MGLPNRKVVFQASIFRGYVSFRECTSLYMGLLPKHWFTVHEGSYRSLKPKQGCLVSHLPNAGLNGMPHALYCPKDPGTSVVLYTPHCYTGTNTHTHTPLHWVQVPAWFLGSFSLKNVHKKKNIRSCYPSLFSSWPLFVGNEGMNPSIPNIHQSGQFIINP